MPIDARPDNDGAYVAGFAVPQPELSALRFANRAVSD
jgi:hypothetical protein